MQSLAELGKFEIALSHRHQFASGELWREWAKRYSNLFDEDDQRLAQSAARLGQHFYEWHAAVLLYEEMGYLSLVEKYQFKKHKRKRELFEALVPSKVVRLIDERKRYGNVQCPDLLAYSSDRKDWFFCEVKGPADSFKPTQMIFFKALARGTGKPVRVLRFTLNTSGESELALTSLRRVSPVQWTEGRVGADEEHILITYGDVAAGENLLSVARLAPTVPGAQTSFVVEFLPFDEPHLQEASTIREQVQRELDFYLIELHKLFPWQYAIYHCSTTANVYSNVHWGYFPRWYIEQQKQGSP